MLRHENEELYPQNDVWTTLELWRPEPISPDFNRRLYARIEQFKLEKRRRLYRAISLSSALAAALAVFFLSRPPKQVVRTSREEIVAHSSNEIPGTEIIEGLLKAPEHE